MPENPVEIEKRVWALFDSGNVRAALAACQDLNQRFPDFTSGWRSASQLALKINQPSVALHAIEQALVLEPECLEWLLQKAVCLSRLNHLDLLSVQIAKMRNADFTSDYQCSTFALLLTKIGKYEQAREYYQQAITFKPNDSQHHYNLASVYRFLGNVELAEKSYDTAIALNPLDCEAYRLRSELRQQTVQENNIDSLNRVLDKYSLPLQGKAQIYYALAKEWEDLSEHKKSFEAVSHGAKARRSSFQYSPESDLSTLKKIRDVFTSEIFSGVDNPLPSSKPVGVTPIFILGLPRTGTTLVERILASHDDVISAGELNNFSFSLVRQIQAETGAKNLSKERLVELSKNTDFGAIGNAYMESTLPVRDKYPFFIDKLPLNYLYLGLITLALPNAKIVNLQRHPLDACYAMYKQLFKDAYPFSYDLEELGRYYVEYQRLMEHWNRVLPGYIHTVRYENLVDDVENYSKQVVEYCGLSWQEKCLDFHTSKEASTTASAIQIREPIYTRSVGRWKHYRNELAPLIRILTEEGVAIDGL